MTVIFVIHIDLPGTPTPTATPALALPTPKPPVTSPNWTFTGRHLRDMSGEVLLLLHDINQDKTVDILAGNSGTPDFDPSFVASYQNPTGSFSDFATLPGLDHIPGYHTSLILNKADGTSLVDIKGAILHSLNLLTMEYDENAVFDWRSQYLYNLDRNYSFDTFLAEKNGMLFGVSTTGANYFSPNSVQTTSALQFFQVLSGGEIIRSGDRNTSMEFLPYVITSMAFIAEDHLIAAGYQTLPGGFKNLLLETRRNASGNWWIGPNPYQPAPLAILSLELPTSLAAADLDGDGDRDLVVREGSTVSTFLNRDSQLERSSHAFLPKPYQNTNLFRSTPYSVNFPGNFDPLVMKNTGEFLLQPVDGDAYPDVLAFSGGLIYLPGRGDGTFGEYEYIDPFFHATSCAVADLDGDGSIEIVVSRSNEVRIYSRPAAGAASPIRFLPREPMGAVETLAGNRWVSGTTPAIEVGTSFAKTHRLALGSGSLFVSDSEKNQIRVRDSAGVWSVLSDAQGQPLALTSPAGMLVHRDRLYICDSGSNRLVVYDLAAKEIRNVTGSAGISFSNPSDIKALSDTQLVIADTGSNDVKVLELETGVIRSLFPADLTPKLREPIALAVGTDGSLYVTENIKPGVKKFWRENGVWTQTQLMGGRFGDDYPRGLVGNSMLYPEGVAVLPNGSVVVADAGNQRLLQWKDGRVTVFAGRRQSGFQVDGFPRTHFHFGSPTDIAVLSDTELLVADGDSIRLVRLGEENSVLPEPIPYDLVPTPPASTDPTPTPPSPSTVREYPIH